MSVGPLEMLALVVLGLLLVGPQQLPQTAARFGRGVRDLRNALWSDDVPLAEAEPVSRDSAQVLELIAAAATDASRTEDLSALDATVELRAIGTAHTATVDARINRDAPGERVTVSIAPHCAQALWSGRLHEPAQIATGGLMVTGELRRVLAAIDVLPAVAEHLRTKPDGAAAAARFPYVRQICWPDPVRELVREGYRLRDDRNSQAVLAAIVMAALEPSCRAAEAPYLARAHEPTAEGTHRLVAVVGALAALAAEDTAELLHGTE